MTVIYLIAAIVAVCGCFFFFLLSLSGRVWRLRRALALF